MAKKKNPRFDSPVRITITSFRHRLADCRGISVKAAIDGLVGSGVLVDDSPEFVQEIRTEQVKIGREKAEKTQIVIESMGMEATSGEERKAGKAAASVRSEATVKQKGLGG